MKISDFRELKEDITRRVEIQKELIEIETERAIANTINLVSSIGVLLLFVLSLNVGVAELINHFMENRFAGYLILAGFYLLVFIILLFARGTAFIIANRILEIFKREIFKK